MYALRNIICKGRARAARIFTWTGKAFICMTSFKVKRDYMWGFVYASPESAFALITFRSAPFCAFWISVYKKRSPDTTVFCTKSRLNNRWFWPQKVEHKRTPKSGGNSRVYPTQICWDAYLNFLSLFPVCVSLLPLPVTSPPPLLAVALLLAEFPVPASRVLQGPWEVLWDIADSHTALSLSNTNSNFKSF